jgi:tetratricopeptide (TPR) repeat protein
MFVVFASGCTQTSTDTAAGSNSNTEPVAQFASASDALAEGNRLLDVNETEKAIAAFNQAIAMDPDLGEAYFQLGIAYALLEKEQKGELKPGETATVVPGEKTDNRKTDSEKAFEKAVSAYKKQLEKDPDDDVAQFNLGRALNKLNKDEEAEKAFRQAVKLKPDDSEYQTELGAILIKLAQYREAIPPLKKALELDAENLQAQELLDDAEAGRRRIDYVAEKKDNKQGANSNANSAESNSIDANSAVNSRPGKIQIEPMPITREQKKTPPPNKPSKPQ